MILIVYVLQAKALYTKISNETDNLRNLWVAKLNLKGKSEMVSPEDLRAYERINEKVNAESQFNQVATINLSHNAVIHHLVSARVKQTKNSWTTVQQSFGNSA